MKREQCMGDAYFHCVKDAEWIRHTQFAGSHPLCEQHAKEDPDFMINSSYQTWTKIQD